MNAFNTVTTAIFDVLLAPFGEAAPWAAWLDMLLWSVVFGVVALLSFKYTSNQTAIARTKNGFKVRLLEIRLFKDDIGKVLGATTSILAGNVVYLAYNLVPLLVMVVPMVAVVAQLEARYAFDPAPTGSAFILEVKLDPEHTDVAPADVHLVLPAGVRLEAPPVHTADGEIAWRLRAESAGDHVLRIQVGGQTIEKGLAVGGPSRKVPVLRTKSWEALLYPGEPALPSDAPVLHASLAGVGGALRGYPDRDLGWMPGGEMGVLLTFFVISMAAGLALKNPLDVTF